MQERALTLIELLLVIAIFSILIAAVIPSLTDADVTAKVAQVRTDLRSIGSALEAYRRDHPQYPLDTNGYGGSISGLLPNPLLKPLTTPLAYIAQIPKEVFPTSSTLAPKEYRYVAKDWILAVSASRPDWSRETDRWALASNGPDCYDNAGQYLLFGEKALNQFSEISTWKIGPGCLYDPTNGAISAGDIVLLHEDMLSTAASTSDFASARCWQDYR